MLTAMRFGTGTGIGGGSKSGWNPPTDEHEDRVVAERGEQRHLSFDREEEDARVVDRGEEVDALLVELDRPEEVDLQDDDGHVVGGQRHAQDAEDRDVAGDLDHDPERQAGQRRRAPADLRHRADDEDRPAAAGRTRLRSEMMRCALATTSCGNITEAMALVRTPSTSAGRFIVRWSPRMPPTPSSVNPKPSWMPVPNSAVMTISSEKPVRAVGHPRRDERDRLDRRRCRRCRVRGRRRTRRARRRCRGSRRRGRCRRRR